MQTYSYSLYIYIGGPIQANTRWWYCFQSLSDLHRPNMTRIIRRVGSAMTGHISSNRARYLNRTSLSRPRFDTPNLLPSYLSYDTNHIIRVQIFSIIFMIHSIIIEYVLCSNIVTQLLGRILISRRLINSAWYQLDADGQIGFSSLH